MKYRLIDHITAWEPGGRIAGRAVVGFEAAISLEPLGRDGCLPESLVLGMAAELAWWAEAAASGFTRAALPAGAEAVRFRQTPVHAERLELELDAASGAFRLAGDRGAAADGRLELAICALAGLADPRTVAEDWAVLRGEGG